MSRRPTILIIGAGVGGLATAARLTALGPEVLVLEKAAAPGGKMRALEVGGGEIDVGPTVLTMRWVFEELFAAVGADFATAVPLKRAGTLARHFWRDGAQLDLFDNVNQSAEAIGAFAGPREAKGYLAFARDAERAYRALDQSFIRAERPNVAQLVARIAKKNPRDLFAFSPFADLWGALQRYFRDPRLLQLFGRYATYCGASPYQASATLMLVAHVEREGVWLVEGGLRRLARALAALAEGAGARIRYDAEVARIVVEGGRAVGVETSQGERIAADAVVFNGDVGALAGGLLGEVADVAPPQPSLSALTWALRAPSAAAPWRHHNVLFGADYSPRVRRGVPAQRAAARSHHLYLCRGAGDGRGDRRARAAVRAGQRAAASAGSALIGEGNRGMRAGDEASGGSSGREPGGDAGRADDAARFRDPVSGQPGGAVRPAAAWMAGEFPARGSADVDGAALSGGRDGASGRGRADGGAVGRAGGDGGRGGFGFDREVPSGGYAWWYLDAFSDDGQHGLTIIAFIGSVFSPYYAWSGWRDPLNHCAINVALYGPRARWAMTERRRAAVSRTPDRLQIGPSAVSWDGNRFTAEFDERGAPLPRRLRGRVELEPEGWNERMFALSDRNNHVWRPISPFARVRVALSEPDLTWSGGGYLDFNSGSAPLERDFRRWNWSRSRLGTGAAIFYESERRHEAPLNLSLRFGRDGVAEEAPAPPKVALPKGLWGVARETRSEAGAKVMATFEDSPFYTRSRVAHRLDGQDAVSMHESLDLDRFSLNIVRAMLPFRMPRW